MSRLCESIRYLGSERDSDFSKCMQNALVARYEVAIMVIASGAPCSRWFHSILRSPFTPYAARHKRQLFTVVNASDYKSTRDSMDANKERLSVLQLSASWCGPCRRVKPEIEMMSQKYPEVDFFYIDVEEVQDAGEEYNVTALPTFMFLKGSTTVDRLEGAQAQLVENKLKSLLPQQPA